MTNVSHLFDWSRNPQFFERWGKSFDVASMNGKNNFQLVFSSYCPSNIQDCINGNGALNSNVTTDQVSNCGLKWADNVISLDTDVTWNIGDVVVPLKAVFLRDKNSGFVLGYSINNTPFEITNQLKLTKGLLFWSITDG